MRHKRSFNWVVLALVFSSFTRQPVTAAESNRLAVDDPLAEHWWTDEEEAAFFTQRIVIASPLAKAFDDYLAKSNSIWRAGETRQHLSNNPPFVAFTDLDPLSRPTNETLKSISHQLSVHTNVAIQFKALLGLAGVGDRESVTALLTLCRRPTLSPDEITTLKNLCHRMGIDPVRETPQTLLALAKDLLHPDGNGRPPLGSSAPDFEIKTLAGTPLRLSNFRGKTVLLHFWATSCGPCLAEFPQMTKFLRALHERKNDFVVIAVSLDDNIPKIQNVVKKFKLDWIHVCDGRQWGSEPARLFHVSYVPCDFAIDPEGIIRTYLWNTLDGVMEQFGTHK